MQRRRNLVVIASVLSAVLVSVAAAAANAALLRQDRNDQFHPTGKLALPVSTASASARTTVQLQADGTIAVLNPATSGVVAVSVATTVADPHPTVISAVPGSVAGADSTLLSPLATLDDASVDAVVSDDAVPESSQASAPASARPTAPSTTSPRAPGPAITSTSVRHHTETTTATTRPRTTTTERSDDHGGGYDD